MKFVIAYTKQWNWPVTFVHTRIFYMSWFVLLNFRSFRSVKSREITPRSPQFSKSSCEAISIPRFACFVLFQPCVKSIKSVTFAIYFVPFLFRRVFVLSYRLVDWLRLYRVGPSPMTRDFPPSMNERSRNVVSTSRFSSVIGKSQETRSLERVMEI